MALIQKTAPVALDKTIDAFQSYLFGELGYVEWECYPRAYINPNEIGRVPEYYEGDNEYREVLYDDTFNMSSFFIAGEDEPIAEDGIAETDVSLIVQADLRKVFPLIPHRADEELNNAFRLASLNYPSSVWFTLESVERGIDRVYAEFDREKIKNDNMSNQYVVRFNYRVRYTPEC